MNISRLTTLSLSLAIAVFALGNNPSFANKPTDGKHDHGDEPSLPTGIEIELIGAFEFDDGAVAVTPDSEFKLRGDDVVHMIRPGGAGFDPVDACTTGTATDPLCMDWNGVFDLCNLLGPPTLVDVREFDVSAGRKGWTVEKVVEEVWVVLAFPLVSPLNSSDPLFTESMTASMQLKGACPPAGCSLIPGSGSTLTIDLTDYAIHLRAKGGVTHQATCHAGNSGTNLSWRDEVNILLITAPSP